MSRDAGRRRAALLMALLPAVGGCQYDPNAHRYTTVEPERAQIVGVYTLASQTVSPGGLAAFRGKTCSLELRRDGTFVAANVLPAQTGLPSHNFVDTLVSGSGTWRIDRMGSVDDKTRWGVYLDTPTARFEAVGLSGAKPPYGLIYTIGDPDSGDVLILERTNR